MSKQISFLIAFGTPCFVFISGFKLWLYYVFFGINIFSFIDLPEFAVLFFYDLIWIFVWVVVIGFFASKFFGNVFAFPHDLNLMLDGDDGTFDVYLKRLKKKERYISWPFSVFVGFMMYYLFSSNKRDEIYFYVVVFLLPWLLSFVLSQFNKAIPDLLRASVFSVVPNAIVYFYSFVIGVYILFAYTFFQVHLTNYSPKKMSFVLDGRVVRFGSYQNCYIGNTGKYFFCRIDGHVRVLPMSRIDEIIY